MSNHCHIIGTPTGIFITRSIRRRRLPESFHLEALGELAASPSKHGYANLGHRLIYASRSSLPPGVAVGTTLDLGDKDALAVRDYARAHLFEDADPASISAEAGDSAILAPAELGEQQPGQAQPVDEASGSAPSQQVVNVDMRQSADSAASPSHHAAKRFNRT